MKPKQQAAVLRQVADDLEKGQCPPNFVVAVLTGLFGEERKSRPASAKRRKKRKA